MRISDWSSDVCSSDLRAQGRPRRAFPWSVVTRGPMRRVLATAGILGLLTIGDGFVYLVLQSRGDFAAQWFPLLYVGTNVVFLALAVPLGRLADRVGRARVFVIGHVRSEEHTSELQSLMRISYAVFCLKKKRLKTERNITNNI